MPGVAEWVAVDWGTSNVRAWGIAADGRLTFSAGSDRGMGKITSDAFPAALDDLLAPHADAIEAPAGAPIDIVICGMAGARQGWREAPYLDAPADLGVLGRSAVRPQGFDSRFAPRILPGICQRAAGREDVIRGEETQLLGLLQLRPGFSGVAILPGTHSKWAEIRNGRLLRFSTAMTGELYELLAQHSVLRHSIAAEPVILAEDGIAEGVAAGLARPELLSTLAFRTRAAALLGDKGADWCSGYLSGLLVGAEIGGHRDWLTGAPVPLIGSTRLSRLYGAALGQIGIESVSIDGAEATIAGLQEARRQ